MVEIRTTTPAPITKPAIEPKSNQLPIKPRLRSGEYSATKIAAPEYSPPIEKPWASFPMVSYPGIRPIAKVLNAIIMMVTDKTFCRPNLSPNIPNTTPPNGLTRNGTENVASAAIICTPGDAPGKNT